MLASQEEALQWMESGKARAELFTVAEKMAKQFFPGAKWSNHRVEWLNFVEIPEKTMTLHL